MTSERDHGGGLDAAIATWGGLRHEWLDLSTGINPEPYPIGSIDLGSWTALPDKAEFQRLERAARDFWNVPVNAAVLAAPGASSLIAQMPFALNGKAVSISGPTYNEHQAAFVAAGWRITTHADVQVVVHPNNPDGRMWSANDLSTSVRVIDESFCDVCPDRSLVELAAIPNTVILKSFGKFWGLAGLRLGFAIGDPEIIERLKYTMGPWQVSGPALDIGARALKDTEWAASTRERLADDALRLDTLMQTTGPIALGGTDLFRLYQTDDASAWQAKLARHKVWSRIFPYSKTWLRLGLPASGRWTQLENAL